MQLPGLLILCFLRSLSAPRRLATDLADLLADNSSISTYHYPPVDDRTFAIRQRRVDRFVAETKGLRFQVQLQAAVGFKNHNTTTKTGGLLVLL